jgi:hypothetical protein
MLAGGVLNIISIQIITIGLLAKAYAHLTGLHRDPIVAKCYQWFTFEKMSLISGLVLLIGLLLALKVVFQWAGDGFGELDEPRLLFLAVILLVNGVQIAAASYLFSIMALPRHIDNMPPDLKSTGLSDL